MPVSLRYEAIQEGPKAGCHPTPPHAEHFGQVSGEPVGKCYSGLARAGADIQPWLRPQMQSALDKLG